MGTVPLLTREGEVEIARRIERGKLAVIKSISRTPLVAKKVIQLGDQLHAGERTIRELVIFNDEEITDERIDERSQQVQKQIDAVRKAARGLREARGEAARDAEGRDDPRQAEVSPRAVGGDARARRAVATPSARSSSPKPVKRRLIDEMKDAVESRQGASSARSTAIDRLLNPKNKKQKLRGRRPEERRCGRSRI